MIGPLRRWLLRIVGRRADAKIDALIQGNRYRYRDGMNVVDWTRVDGIGRRRWRDVQRAQYGRPPASVERVVPIRREDREARRG